MTNEKPKSPALDLTPPDFFPSADILGKEINGKPVPKYTGVFILQSVFCENCKNMIAPNGIAWTTNVPQLQDLAEQTHEQGVRNNRVLCGKPRLLIMYGAGFLTSEMLKQ